MASQRGDVLLVPFPYSDLSATKIRPAIIVSSSAYHSTELDIILAAITSRVANAVGAFDYVLRDWQAAGLRRSSAFKPVLFTLDPAKVLHHVGTLGSDDLAEVDNRLRLMLGRVRRR